METIIGILSFIVAVLFIVMLVGITIGVGVLMYKIGTEDLKDFHTMSWGERLGVIGALSGGLFCICALLLLLLSLLSR